MPQLPDPHEVGSRVEKLLGELLTEAGASVSTRAEELVRLLVELYGAGLERVMAIVAEQPQGGPALVDRLVDDDLVASLLILHDLHPVSAEQRARSALARLGPTLGSSPELLGIDDDGVAHVSLGPGCEGVAPTAATRSALERTLEDAAPELSGVELESPSPQPSAAFIPIGSIRRRRQGRSHGRGGDGVRPAEATS